MVSSTSYLTSLARVRTSSRDGDGTPMSTRVVGKVDQRGVNSQKLTVDGKVKVSQKQTPQTFPYGFEVIKDVGSGFGRGKDEELITGDDITDEICCPAPVHLTAFEGELSKHLNESKHLNDVAVPARVPKAIDVSVVSPIYSHPEIKGSYSDDNFGSDADSDLHSVEEVEEDEEMRNRSLNEQRIRVPDHPIVRKKVPSIIVEILDDRKLLEKSEIEENSTDKYGKSVFGKADHEKAKFNIPTSPSFHSEVLPDSPTESGFTPFSKPRGFSIGLKAGALEELATLHFSRYISYRVKRIS